MFTQGRSVNEESGRSHLCRSHHAPEDMLSPVVPQQAVDGVLTPHLKALQYDGGSASSQERAQSPDYKRRTRPPAGDYYRLPCYISAGTFSVFIPNLHHIKSGIHKKTDLNQTCTRYQYRPQQPNKEERGSGHGTPEVGSSPRLGAHWVIHRWQLLKLSDRFT